MQAGVFFCLEKKEISIVSLMTHKTQKKIQKESLKKL